MMRRIARGQPCCGLAMALALAAAAHVAAPVAPWRRVALNAQTPAATDIVVAFDDAGRLREITPGIADRLGLRAPWWPVDGEYKRARLLRTDAATWVLEVQRFDATADRVPLSDDQVGQLRLEITARSASLARSTGRPFESPPLATVAQRPSGASDATPPPPRVAPAGAVAGLGDDRPISRGAFIARETVLGTALFAPLAWVAVDARAFSPSAALFTAAGSYLLATNAVNRAPFGVHQTQLGTLAALAGAAGGAGVTYAAGVGSREGRALAALAGGVGLHVAAMGWGRGATGDEVGGTLFGATVGGLAGAGLLGAGRVFERSATGNDRWTAGMLSVGVLAVAPLGRAWVRSAPYRVTSGDLGAMGLAAITAGALGYGAAGASVAAPFARYAVPTALGAGGLWLGARALASPYDHGMADVGTMAAAGAVGAAIAVLPYRLSGGRHDGTSWVLGSLGAVIGLWGGEVVTRPGAGTTRAPRVSAQLLPAGLVGLATRTPGAHPLFTLRF